MQFRREMDFDVGELLAIGRHAGKAILDIYETFVHEKSDGIPRAMLGLKSDNSPLSIADLKAHEIISAGLNALSPHLQVVSEEDESSHLIRSDSEHYWLIDPLDGTKEFLGKSGDFTVNIALISGNQPRFGLVFAPAVGEMYWGGRSFGAYCQRIEAELTRIHVSSHVPLPGELRVLASKSHMNAETFAYVSGLGPTTLVQAGSSLKFCRLAEGQADIYPRLGPTCEWDTAAGQAVLEGAGGHVLKLDGQSLVYGKSEILNPSFVAVSNLMNLQRS